MPDQFAYVGSDSRAQIAAGESEGDAIGIAVYAIDATDGSLQPVQTLLSDNAFYFDFDAEQRHVYGVNVIDDFAGGTNGSVEAYARDPKTGKLTFLNRVDAGGAIPAQPAVSPSGRWLVVANYGGANLTVFPIESDGSLGTLASETKRTGNGPDAARQDQPRPHAALFAPAGNLVAIADLGTDDVVIYALDEDTGQLTKVSSVRVTPGRSTSCGLRRIGHAPLRADRDGQRNRSLCLRPRHRPDRRAAAARLGGARTVRGHQSQRRDPDPPVGEHALQLQPRAT